jgi:hypothetical protein
MLKKLTRTMLPIMIALGACLAGDSAEAGGFGRRNAAGPEIYPSPHPVPAWVGVTPLTYQPLYPHEFLHKHYDVYRRYDNGRRIIPSNTTRALYW